MEVFLHSHYDFSPHFQCFVLFFFTFTPPSSVFLPLGSRSKFLLLLFASAFLVPVMKKQENCDKSFSGFIIV